MQHEYVLAGDGTGLLYHNAANGVACIGRIKLACMHAPWEASPPMGLWPVRMASAAALLHFFNAASINLFEGTCSLVPS
jgi:hypothetical protein